MRACSIGLQGVARSSALGAGAATGSAWPRRPASPRPSLGRLLRRLVQHGGPLLELGGDVQRLPRHNDAVCRQGAWARGWEVSSAADSGAAAALGWRGRPLAGRVTAAVGPQGSSPALAWGPCTLRSPRAHPPVSQYIQSPSWITTPPMTTLCPRSPSSPLPGFCGVVPSAMTPMSSLRRWRREGGMGVGVGGWARAGQRPAGHQAGARHTDDWCAAPCHACTEPAMPCCLRQMQGATHSAMVSASRMQPFTTMPAQPAGVWEGARQRQRAAAQCAQPAGRWHAHQVCWRRLTVVAGAAREDVAEAGGAAGAGIVHHHDPAVAGLGGGQRDHRVGGVGQLQRVDLAEEGLAAAVAPAGAGARVWARARGAQPDARGPASPRAAQPAIGVPLT